MATGSNRHYTVVLRDDNGGIHLHTVSLDSQKPDPQETVLPPGPAAQVGLTRPVPVRTLLKAGFSGSGVRRQGRSPVDHDIMLCRRMFGVLGAAPSVSCKSARNACQKDSAEGGLQRSRNTQPKTTGGGGVAARSRNPIHIPQSEAISAPNLLAILEKAHSK